MQWLRDLLEMGFRPRLAMRRVLDRGRAPVLPLVVAATVSAMLKDLSIRDIARVVRSESGKTVATIALGIVIGAVVAVGLFYLLSWMAVYAGRLLEGRATPPQVRAALAWGLAPAILLLPIRVLIAFVRPATEVQRIGGMVLPTGSVTGALVVLVINAIVGLWTIYILSETLGEANEFSGWKGFGTLAIIGATPVVIALAAFLASR